MIALRWALFQRRLLIVDIVPDLSAHLPEFQEILFVCHLLIQLPIYSWFSFLYAFCYALLYYQTLPHYLLVKEELRVSGGLKFKLWRIEVSLCRMRFKVELILDRNHVNGLLFGSVDAKVGRLTLKLVGSESGWPVRFDMDLRQGLH